MHANPTQMRLTDAARSTRDLMDDYYAAREEMTNQERAEARDLQHAGGNFQ